MSSPQKLISKIKRLLPNQLKDKLPAQINVVKISMSESRRLNRKYRRKNQPANVLSFRYGPDYGEILLCPEVIKRDAKKTGNSYKRQMTSMILHGIIHLAGIHHEKSPVLAKKVGRMEREILLKLSAK